MNERADEQRDPVVSSAAVVVVARSLLVVVVVVVVGSGACMALDSFCGRLLSRAVSGSDRRYVCHPSAAPHGFGSLLPRTTSAF